MTIGIFIFFSGKGIVQTFWLVGTIGQATIQPKTPDERITACQLFQAGDILQKSTNILLDEVGKLENYTSN